VIAGYTLGTRSCSSGYQKGAALTVAGMATLLTNALPIAAGTVVLGEPVPSGVFGALRVLAFAAVTVGAVLLARPNRAAATVDEPSGQPSVAETLTRTFVSALFCRPRPGEPAPPSSAGTAETTIVGRSGG
jgi:hypothetical protein